MSKRLAKRLLLIGWDAADWQHIQPLLSRGEMPTLQRFMEQGVHGNIATLQPMLSPMLWNSIAAGKRPHKNGIHGFVEPAPDGKGVRPSSSTTRRCKAIWNILTQEGLKTNVVGWFCSHPAEAIDGVCVSNLYHRVPITENELSPLAEGTVHPASWTRKLADLRLHPRELDEHHLLPFVPNAARIDQAQDRRLTQLAKLLAECINMQSAATFVMERTDWDFTAVYFDSIDHFCHGFMQCHPPWMQHVSDADFELYRQVIAGCYRFHDMMLERLLQLAGDDAMVIICSDHGFHCGKSRPIQTPREPAGPAHWHRPYGFCACRGRTSDRTRGSSGPASWMSRRPC